MKILYNELKNFKISIFFLLIATYVSTTFELTLPLLMANALNVGIIQNYGLKYIKNIGIMMLSLIIAILVLNIIISFIITRISNLTSCSIRNKLFEKTISLKNNDFKTIPISSLITRVNQDTEQIKNFIVSFLSIVFKAPILLFSCITILKRLNSKFFLILFISIIIIIIFLAIMVLKLIPLSKKIQLKIDVLNKHLKEKISGYKIIKSYNNFDLEDTKFEETNEEYFKTSKQIIKLSSLVNPFLTLIVNLVTIIILLICIKLIKVNTIETGTIIATIQYILQILLSIVMISMIIISFPTIKISTNRIEEVLNLNSYAIEKDLKLNEINSITYNDVSFSYENDNLINNLSLQLTKDTNIGIIGLNGSGKSTLIKLLLKEENLKNGSIKINDIDINELSRKDITNNITYNPSMPYILKGTILENIAFANKNLTMQDIAKIINTCSLEKFISSKKDNFNYLLQENGANLSKGQKQRIALARALAKPSNFIILDDPFSALDYSTEKEILTKLNQYYKEKTFVIISQRISSIMNCNKILVMDKGKIISQGSHEELLKNCSLYKEIYNSQKEVIEYDI